MEREITTVGLYIRKSREDEDEQALNRQQSVLIDLCKKNGWKYDLYKEVGSSQDLDRPQLQLMLDKVRSFGYDAIVCADLDRLSRNTGHFGTIKEVIINACCLVVTPSKVYDFSKQEDDLFSDIQSVLAKNEYQTIKKRLTRGTRQSAKDGNWLGKKSPIGYKYNRDKKKLEPSEDAIVIKKLFQDYIYGLSTKDIAYKYTMENVNTTVGMKWTSSGISRLLSNPVYKGVSIYGRTKVSNGKRGVKTNVEDQIIVENSHEAIIDREIWDKVQQIKTNRNSKPIALKLGKHMFSGLIKCGICGRIHSFQHSKGKKKRINSCQTRHYTSVDSYTMCENQGGNIEDFNKLFFKYFKQHVALLEDYIEKIKSKSLPKKNMSFERIKMIEKQLKNIEQDTKRVQQGFMMKIFTDEEAQKQIEGFKIHKDSLEKELLELQEKVDNSSIDYYEKVLNNLKDFLSGHSKIPEHVSNDIIREHYEAFIYNKNTKTEGKMRIKVVLKNGSPLREILSSLNNREDTE